MFQQTEVSNWIFRFSRSAGEEIVVPDRPGITYQVSREYLAQNYFRNFLTGHCYSYRENIQRRLVGDGKLLVNLLMNRTNESSIMNSVHLKWPKIAFQARFQMFTREFQLFICPLSACNGPVSKNWVLIGGLPKISE